MAKWAGRTGWIVGQNTFDQVCPIPFDYKEYIYHKNTWIFRTTSFNRLYGLTIHYGVWTPHLTRQTKNMTRIDPFISLLLIRVYLNNFGAIKPVSDAFPNDLSRMNNILKHGLMHSSKGAVSRSLSSRTFLWWPHNPSGGNENHILSSSDSRLIIIATMDAIEYIAHNCMNMR